MINSGAEDNLKDELKESFDQMIKVIEEKFKAIENVNEENRLIRKEIQHLSNEIKEEKNLYQKATENAKEENRTLKAELDKLENENVKLTRKLCVLEEENMLLHNKLIQLENERQDITKRLEVIIQNNPDR